MNINHVTLQVARKLAMAEQSLASTRAQAATMAAQEVAPQAEDWARYANRVAKAEGVHRAWARLQQTVSYFAREGMELTDLALLDTILELLGAGADDGWSGRTNDNQRAKFDGIREACNQAKYLVIAD